MSLKNNVVTILGRLDNERFSLSNFYAPKKMIHRDGKSHIEMKLEDDGEDILIYFLNDNSEWILCGRIPDEKALTMESEFWQKELNVNKQRVKRDESFLEHVEKNEKYLEFLGTCSTVKDLKNLNINLSETNCKFSALIENYHFFVLSIEY